ncbi:UNVERIFIED_CONTAM: hypothetical protein RMT77_015475 [Armadillidium vulgare]
MRMVSIAFLIVWLLFQPFSQATNEKSIKVTNSLPKETEDCLITEVQLAKSDFLVGCQALCQRYQNCLLACILGDRCRLYDVNVSTYYKGVQDADPELVNYKCHSFWNDVRDIANTATFTASPTNFEVFAKEKAALGYSCPRYNWDYFYCSKEDVDRWLLADLGETRKVEMVIIQARGVIPIYDFATCFKAIEVRVGNTPGSGNFEANTLLMYYEGEAPKGEIITFKGKTPLEGRYVSVQAKTKTYLVIMEMKIIPI